MQSLQSFNLPTNGCTTASLYCNHWYQVQRPEIGLLFHIYIPFVRYMTNKGMERLRAENFLKDLFPGTGNSQKSARGSSANFNDFHHGCYFF